MQVDAITVVGFAALATVVASLVASAWAGCKAREAVEGCRTNDLALAEADADRRARAAALQDPAMERQWAANRAADALATGRVESRPRDENRDFFRMKAGDTVKWRTVPWAHGVVLEDLFFGAARGRLDAVVVGTIIANNIVMMSGMPSMAGKYRLASWFLPGHPGRPLLQSGLLGPADQVTVDLVALEDVDLVVYARWSRAPFPRKGEEDFLAAAPVTPADPDAGGRDSAGGGSP